MNDLVNKPDHYNIGGIETIDIIKSMLTEEEFKGNDEQDYAKAKKYYDWLKELADNVEISKRIMVAQNQMNRSGRNDIDKRANT